MKTAVNNRPFYLRNAYNKREWLMFHYVYQVTSTDGRFYLGVRSSRLPPDEDKYTGSGSWVKFGFPGHLSKQILNTFPSRELAEAFEASLLSSAILDANCMNQSRRRYNATLSRQTRIKNAPYVR